jgi:hypothetical protein
MPRRVYVIELERAAGRRRDPRLPWLYVGSSARSPARRFEQHLSGYKSAGLVKRFALRLRPDLYEDLEPLGSSLAAVEAETERARELASCGFVAHCDGVSHGKGEAFWSEWEEVRLEPVAHFVDEAARELGAAAFEPLSAADCARLLHGERGFWVQRYLDQEDPPPGYGMFPHVSLAALRGRVGDLTSSSCSSSSAS